MANSPQPTFLNPHFPYEFVPTTIAGLSDDSITIFEMDKHCSGFDSGRVGNLLPTIRVNGVPVGNPEGTFRKLPTLPMNASNGCHYPLG